jgi:hypothetical protein
MTGSLVVRSGFGFWWDGYRSMLRFETRSLRRYLTIGVVVQVLMGAGMALMYGYYFGDLTPVQQTFIVTGIPALAMVPVGFAMVPASVMDHKIRNTYDYVWSLPVPERPPRRRPSPSSRPWRSRERSWPSSSPPSSTT